jgi:Sep15/SelM redox domain
LNRLPEVRTFLKEPGHADSYEKLKVTFIAGRNPDLFIRDDNGELLETIDLSKMTTAEIHELLVQKGFERNAAGAVGAQSEL